MLNEIGQKGFGLLEAGVTLEAGRNYRLSLFGRNLTNSTYAEQGSRYFFGQPTAAGRGFIFFGGEPRNYGIELSVKY